MGYASLSPVSVLELGSPPQTSEATIIAGGVTFDLKNLDIPAWLTDKVERAYLDWYIPYFQNTHADFNWIDTCDGIYITPDDGLNYYKAIDVPNHTLYYVASSTYNGMVRLTGTYDLSSYVIPGGHWHIQVQNAVCHGDTISLLLNYCVLRCYLYRGGQ